MLRDLFISLLEAVASLSLESEGSARIILSEAVVEGEIEYSKMLRGLFLSISIIISMCTCFRE